jgi:hypothetical protein
MSFGLYMLSLAGGCPGQERERETVTYTHIAEHPPSIESGANDGSGRVLAVLDGDEVSNRLVLERAVEIAESTRGG